MSPTGAGCWMGTPSCCMHRWGEAKGAPNGLMVVCLSDLNCLSPCSHVNAEDGMHAHNLSANGVCEEWHSCPSPDFSQERALPKGAGIGTSLTRNFYMPGSSDAGVLAWRK